MVLIVDDDVQLVEGLESYFRAKGIEVAAVTSGIKALTTIQLKKPRLIILDLNMPGLDGISTLRGIRNDEAFKNVPIVIYSADMTQEIMDQALAAGAQEYIVKGVVGWKELLERVKRLLGTE